jgi:hypothetical protein
VSPRRNDPALTEEQIEQLLALARPAPEHRGRCRLDAIEAVRMVADGDPDTRTARDRRREHIERAKKLAAARDVVLGDPFANRESIARELDWHSRWHAAEAARIRVGRSGGPNRADYIRKKLAACLAHDLLDVHGHAPTMTKGGRYLTLTALIFRLATGRAANVERPCAVVLDENRADTSGCDGFFGPRKVSSSAYGKQVKR